MSDLTVAPTSTAADVPWPSFLLVGAILAVTQLGFYLTSAALPLYLRDLGAAQSHIGFEVGSGNLAALGVTLVLGPAINRFGSKLFVCAGACLYVVTALGMLLIDQEVSVTVFRTLQGVGNAMMAPSAFVLAVRLLPTRHGVAIGTLGMLNSLALAAGPPIGLALYTDHGAGWLFLPAVAVAAIGLFSTLLLPSDKAPKHTVRGFGFDRVWLGPLVSNALAAMYFGGILAYLPLFLRQAHGPNAGIFFTADALGVLLLRVPTGMLVDRYGSLAPRLIGLLITLPGIWALALPPSVGALIVSGACTGIGAGMFITGVLADLSRLSTESNRGTALSLGTGSFSGAIFIGSAASGLIIGPGGFNAVLLFGALTCAAAFPFIWIRPAERASGARNGQTVEND